jgi:hypothetical protein
LRSEITHIILFSFFLTAPSLAVSQAWRVQGQASTWLKSNPDESLVSQAGFRYIPELSIQNGLGDDVTADMELSLNAFATANYAKNRSASYEARIKPYRGWLRLASSTFEARVGLQKINFGSATLFRPLMWFDRIDPRDPLQLTDGVYALLLRYYLLNNANVWLWGLYGNNETKGWEIAPTKDKSIEYGGRAQTPLLTGEIAVSYHHRKTDIRGPANLSNTIQQDFTPEDRLGLDGKWDAGIGVWFEAVLLHQRADLPGMKYQRLWTLGADYTFPDLIGGNGLNVLTEYFRSEKPEEPFASANGLGLSALSLSYPLGVVDRLSAILYRDWTNREWYRLVTWQRTYDNWIIYLLGFWNPENIQLYQNQTSGNSFAGTGVQLMIVFNH